MEKEELLRQLPGLQESLTWSDDVKRQIEAYSAELDKLDQESPATVRQLREIVTLAQRQSAAQSQLLFEMVRALHFGPGGQDGE